jgi:quercetin dioxygenase-like cupin family protein
MEGEFVFEIGEPGKAKRTTMSAGDSVLAPRGLPHVFSFISENPGRTLVAFTPAEKIEAFFRKVSVEGAPVPLTKELLEQYGMVFVGPPLSI